MNLFLLYVWGQLGALDFLEATAFFLSIIVAIAAFICKMSSADDPDDTPYKISSSIFKRSLSVLAVVSLMSLIIPSQKAAAILAGGWLTQQIATSGEAKEIGGKTYELILGKLNSELEKMTKGKK